MRRTNKSNRASSTGGSLHTGGSITYPAIAKKMAVEIGCESTQSEVFVRTHTKKKDRGQYVDDRSEQMIELYKAEVKRLEDEREARIAAGEPAGPPIDEDEVWDRVAGGRRRGQVYGKGKVPKRPAPRLVYPEDASTCSGPDAMEHITLLNQEIQQQDEAYKREMEDWKRRYETDVTRLQTTIDTQSAEFNQWKSTVSQMYSFMQQQMGSSSSSMPPLTPPPPLSARPPRPPPATTVGGSTPSATHLDDGSSSSDDGEDDYA
ncbi:hypothetical protein PIB30_077558 [Stylosanthes scabra]|uniref:Uncharacterized protein n=1 Tax=Stylosanthes scabra TaxID=79078 RepID=A0ABU6WQ82_9FABA|nr:hypothetical protein [Stylosanthes scabra]